MRIAKKFKCEREIVYLNCGEKWYEDTIDCRSYVHNLRSCDTVSQLLSFNDFNMSLCLHIL